MKKLLIPLLILLITLPASMALFRPGFFGASDDIHIAWLHQLHHTLLAGQFPPRYVPDLSYGFGYPLFNFVYPLPYYLGEIFHLAGLSFTYSIKAVFMLSLFLSGLAMFRLVTKFSSISAGLIATAIYVYTPYRSTDIYSRGALGESLSFVFLPLICLSMISLSSLRWRILGGLAIAGLILCHDITAYMFLPFAFMLGLVSNKLSSISRLFSVFFIGLLISSFFWIPALVDSSLMQYSTVFNYLDHFPTINQLIRPNWSMGASVPGPYDGMSFFIGFANLIALVTSVIVVIWHRHKLTKPQISIFIWSIVSFLAVFFMMNFRSSFLWDHLPLLLYFQFPWRFLIITTLTTSILSASLIGLIRSPWLVGLLIILIVGLSSPIFRPHDFLNRDDSYFLNRYIPVPSASPEYRQTQEEYLRLPLTTSVRPSENYPRVYPVANLTNLKLVNSLAASFDSSSSSALVLNYNKYFFPGWRAKIDNKPLRLSPGKPYGQITFTLPPGVHHVEIYFAETPLKLILDLFSLSGLLLLLWKFKHAKN